MTEDELADAWPVYTRDDMARAWWEGHMTRQRLGPDDCKCGAWNESECGCGEYGSNVITPNPYKTDADKCPSCGFGMRSSRPLSCPNTEAHQ